MKRNITIFALLTLALLVGCTGSGTQGDPNIIDSKSGTSGVQIAFAPESPPSTLYDDETYTLVLEVKNPGAYPFDDSDEVDVELYFTGFDPEVISLDQTSNIGVEGGRTVTNPQGGIDFYEEDFDITLFDSVDSLNQKITATACYEYETQAPIQVCVDPNPTRNADDSCTPGATGIGGGQGGPIAVTDVRQETLKGKATFTIRLSNVGGGEVYKTDRVDECLNLGRTDSNVLEVLEVELGGESLDCQPEDEIRLLNGVGTLRCQIDGLDEDSPAYETSLNVHVGYGYKDSVSKTVSVRRIE